MEKKLYFKNLDASRFFAFLLVFLAHCFVAVDPEVRESGLFSSIYHWGKLGVLGLEYFFVLSSFLISTIILEESSQNGDFHLPNFLLRRTLRVWPLYFLIVLLGYLVIGGASFIHIVVSPLPPWPYLTFFVVNFYIIQYGTEFLFFIAFLWSISVEEQFYLLWSLVMKFAKVRFKSFCLFLILTSLLFRYLYLDEDKSLYFHTVSTLGNFGVGGWLAWSVHKKRSIIDRMADLKPAGSWALYLILILSLAFYHQLMQWHVFKLFSRLYFSILFAYLILNQSRGTYIPFEMGRWKVLDHLGKISYGLYCYHGLVITLLILVIRLTGLHENYLTAFGIWPVLIFTVTVLLSRLSYRYFEGPFLKMKEGFYNFRP